MRRVSSPTFVGRAEELAAADAALASAADGDPGVLLVAGDSGVGKTRLIAELATRARAGGARVLTGDCVDLGDGELPYAPIVGALRELQRDVGAETLAELAGPLGAELGLLLPGAGEPAPGARAEELAQARLFEALLSLLGRLGEQGDPVVVVIEDLHWSDRSTRDFLSFLCRALRDERLMLVATYRSDELHRRHPLRPFLAELERLERVERVELRPFSRLELVAQLTGILGTRPDPAVVDALYERSEGNPFFAEELLAAADGAGGAALPETLRDALIVRVEALSQGTQELLRVVAGSGRSVTHGLLAEVFPADEPELIGALREAVAHHLLVQHRGDDTYAFRHALMREALYEDLLPGERGALHVRLAEALARDPSLSADGHGAAGELAWHWYQAHDLPRALRASVEAAEQAEAMRAPAQAARHLENAVELWDRVPQAEQVSTTTLLELLRRTAELQYLAGDSDRAVALGRRALAIASPDPVAAALLHERLGRYLWTTGDDREAAEEYARAVELMPAEPPSVERARVLASRAQVLMLNDRPEESARLAREAIEIARMVGDRDVEAHALNTLGVVIAALGSREEGIALLRESLAIERELDGTDHPHRAYMNLSDALDQAGRIDEAIELAFEGAREASRHGMGRGFSSILLAEVANRYTRMGRLAEADRLTGEALDYGGAGIPAGLAHQVRARVMSMMGRWEEAESHVAEARRLLGRTSGSMWIAPLYGGLVELADRSGDIVEVRRLVAEAQRLMEGGEYSFFVRELYLAAMRAEADAAVRARSARDGDAEAEARRSGRALATRLRELAEQGTPPPQVAADVARIAAEESRLEDRPSPELWRTAAERNDSLGNVAGAAYARLREAEARLAAGGERGEVAAALRVAHAAAAECGAEPLRQACEALARRSRIALGDRAEPIDDPFGLTAREREVLELVAAGRTNRQIGEQLFMSEKTASVHVSRILAKLEVSTRGEAGAVAHKVGLAG